MDHRNDTIIAIATAPQNGAIGVLRLSGPAALTILTEIFFTTSGKNFLSIKPRFLHYGKILSRSKEVLDDAMAVYMPAPHSFTGEDVVELHCHGNVILLRRILGEILSFTDELTVRAALPGEFTKRAFLNGRMDLTQAEAVHEIITAESEAALKTSLANLDGALYRHIKALKDELRVSLALVEASFEFPEEDIQTFDRASVMDLITRSRTHLENLATAFATSKLYDAGVAVALVGRPNVGKSSLLNAILVEDRAIVTAIPGTTRDVIEGSRIINGVRYVFRDTAGLRDTTDVVESAGIARSQEWIEKSDLVFWISDSITEYEIPETLHTLNKGFYKVLNKADLLSQQDLKVANKRFDCVVSAQNGFGLEKIQKALLDFLSAQAHVQNSLHMNLRQHKNIQVAIEILAEAQFLDSQSRLSEDILAEELREVIRLLEEVTGEITNDDVLGEIFQRFCIGK